MKTKLVLLLGSLGYLMAGFSSCTRATVGREFSSKECFNMDLLESEFEVVGPIETSFPMGNLAKLSGKTVDCAGISKRQSGSGSEIKKCYVVTMKFSKDEGTTNFNLAVGNDSKISSVVELVGLGEADQEKLVSNYQQLEKLVLPKIDKARCLVPDGEVIVRK